MLLKYIYTFFIGVLTATFIGVGISAFYEGPKTPEFPIEESIPYKYETEPASQSAEELRTMREQNIRQDKAFREYQVNNRIYNRNVSVITSIAAVILLVISLTLLKKLDLLSDGLLLGGLFTQLYSIVRGFESQDSMFRFLVVTVGLITSLTVGYFKFIHSKRNQVSAG
jgi:hypothetical protein